MPYRVCKTFEIESGHLLTKHPGKCRFPHGHSRRVEVVLVADQLDGNDMVCDFKAVKLALRDFLAGWDHALALNTDDPHYAFHAQQYGERLIPFPHADPTTERMAKAVFDEMRRRLAQPDPATPHPIAPGVRVERVRVSETSSTWAEYAE